MIIILLKMVYLNVFAVSIQMVSVCILVEFLLNKLDGPNGFLPFVNFVYFMFLSLDKHHSVLMGK